MQYTKRRTGFTLVELLVVIAIIGILAGLMLPNIAKNIAAATATKLGSNARSVVMAILTKNIDRDALSKGGLWPEDKKGGGVEYGTGTANAYFDAIHDLVPDLKLNMFSGGGVDLATKWDEFQGGSFNAWHVFKDGKGENPIFMVTRNFGKGQSSITVPDDGYSFSEDDFDA
ncbi:MAG: type II secretion system GspH family protein, partial [Kiritimatiellaeota bacterium]|nr:type II secretion system GspH family protein [Kiritimatiellota bacterium]